MLQVRVERVVGDGRLETLGHLALAQDGADGLADVTSTTQRRFLGDGATVSVPPWPTEVPPADRPGHDAGPVRTAPDLVAATSDRSATPDPGRPTSPDRTSGRLVTRTQIAVLQQPRPALSTPTGPSATPVRNPLASTSGPCNVAPVPGTRRGRAAGYAPPPKAQPAPGNAQANGPQRAGISGKPDCAQARGPHRRSKGSKTPNLSGTVTEGGHRCQHPLVDGPAHGDACGSERPARRPHPRAPAHDPARLLAPRPRRPHGAVRRLCHAGSV